MLDFSEVGRRIMQLNCDCPMCKDSDISHDDVAQPLIQQLGMEDPSSPNGQMLTWPECNQLATFIQRQAMIMDMQQEHITKLAPLHERMAVAVKWGTRGLVVCGGLLAWVVSMIVVARFVKGV